MDSPTEDLAIFVSTLDMASASPALCSVVSQHVLDVIAGVYAGIDIPEAVSVAKVLGDGPAAVAGRIAMLAHAAESDPIHAGTTICAGLVAVPPALLLSPDGATASAAVVAGYETAIRIGTALGSSRLLGMGWWPTAVLGGAGSAAAAARAMGLSPDQTQNAIALTVVQSGGLGTGAPDAPESRNLLAANSVRTGVEAAQAAAVGIKGPPEPLTGDRGFLTAFGLEPAPERLLAGLGENWMIAQTSLKAFPCALQAQSALAALGEVLFAENLAADEIIAVEFGLPGAMRRIVDRPGVPRSRFAAAASLQFLAAIFLRDGDILPARMAENGRRDTHVANLMNRISVNHDDTLDAAFPITWPANVRVLTRFGEFRSAIDTPPGHPDKPLEMAETIGRFRAYSDGKLSSLAQNTMIEAVTGIADLQELGPVTSTLRTIL